VLAAIIVIVGAIADVGSIFGLAPDVQLISSGAVVGAFALAVAIGLLRSGGHWKLGIVAVVVLTAAAGIFGAGVRHKSFETSDAPTPTPTPSPSLVQAVLLDPSPDNAAPLPMCFTLRFKATAPPKGKVYVTSVRTSREPRYTFEATVTSGGEDLWAQRLQLGDKEYGAGEDFEIAGYVVDERETTYRATMGGPELHGWTSESLPPEATRIFRVTKQRSAEESGAC
jgi:hypothetical protein